MDNSTLTEAAYWAACYLNGQTGWDIGYPSPALMDFLEQLPDKTISMLVPGAGMGWEAAAAFHIGFKKVFYLDFAVSAAGRFQQAHPWFPEHQVLVQDFFALEGQFDLVLEQTFFCSLHPSKRADWVHKCFQLLQPGGIIAGLLFNHEFAHQGPPYGGTESEYRTLLSSGFEVEHMEVTDKSIKPRALRELFFVARKKSLLH
jgi:thiopurine S-methyltransferase